MRLSHSDLKLVLDSVGILAADPDPATLPARTDDAVRRIVATDVLSFEGFGDDTEYQGPLWYSPVGSVPLERLDVLAEHVFEHCLVEDALRKRFNQAVTVSDYLSLRQFRQTTLYNEFFRYLGTDRQLTVGLKISSELIITTSLCRLRKDFTMRDRLAMELLTPHLIAAFRHPQFVTKMKGESEMPNALQAVRLGVITIGRDLVTRITSPTAIRLLQEFYTDNTDSLPDEIRRYTSHCMTGCEAEFYLPPAPLEVCRPHGTLRIRFTYSPKTLSAMLFLEVVSLSALPAEKAPVTQREAEVLIWISRGKTDAEIASLLGISVRTVNKHIEHIFDKFGVETRTAAMARFLGN